MLGVSFKLLLIEVGYTGSKKFVVLKNGQREKAHLMKLVLLNIDTFFNRNRSRMWADPVKNVRDSSVRHRLPHSFCFALMVFKILLFG